MLAWGASTITLGSVSLAGMVTHVVRVDVQGTLGESQVPHGPSHEVVAQGSGCNVTTPTRDLRRDIGLRAGGECASSTGIDHGLEWARTIGGDNVHGSADRAARGRHLREGRAGLCRDLVHHVDGVLALALGLAQAIGRDVGLLENSSVRLSLAVGAGTGNDTALDAESSGVAACVTGL